MQNDHRPIGVDRQLSISNFDFLFDVTQRQVEYRQGEHHLGEVSVGFGKPLRRKRAALVIGVVFPELVDGYQLGILCRGQKLVVVVFNPLASRFNPAVELDLVAIEIHWHEITLRHVFGVGNLNGVVLSNSIDDSASSFRSRPLHRHCSRSHRSLALARARKTGLFLFRVHLQTE